eukprot:PLAT11040.1.p2 GENE.PLAT11040.1~~PLAT11040.1.p2  ORF type:complete len:642 (+),score=333.62 PLAT11040.1:205-1926(+)
MEEAVKKAAAERNASAIEQAATCVQRESSMTNELQRIADRLVTLAADIESGDGALAAARAAAAQQDAAREAAKASADAQQSALAAKQAEEDARAGKLAGEVRDIEELLALVRKLRDKAAASPLAARATEEARRGPMQLAIEEEAESDIEGALLPELEAGGESGGESGGEADDSAAQAAVADAVDDELSALSLLQLREQVSSAASMMDDPSHASRLFQLLDRLRIALRDRRAQRRADDKAASSAFAQLAATLRAALKTTREAEEAARLEKARQLGLAQETEAELQHLHSEVAVEKRLRNTTHASLAALHETCKQQASSAAAAAKLFASQLAEIEQLRVVVKERLAPELDDTNFILASWVVGDWGACSAPCGASALASRNVSCVNDDNGRAVADEHCDDDLKPATHKPCDEQPPCLWLPSEWSHCSKPCGEGSRTRELSCVAEGSEQPLSAQLCSAERKPAESEVCKLAECAWRVGAWGDCSVPCGSGVQLRTVRCAAGDDGKEQDAAACATLPEPPTEKDCSLPHCTWLPGDWGECVGAVRSRDVQCMPTTGTAVAAELCDETKRPPTTENCEG